jgi:hypothetical protein
MMQGNNKNNGRPDPMSCAEFQEKLPELFAAGEGRITEDSPLHEHLSTCENCSALVRDLQYIAEQASLLLRPVEEEPSDSVWEKIQKGIDSERGNHTKDNSFSMSLGSRPTDPMKV